ncbi:MAG: septum site-determining protein MinC [Chloroflexota bacterium]
MDPVVQIKGIREGLLVTLAEGSWPEVEDALYEEVDHQIDFLSGAKLILDVGNHILNAATMGKLRDVLSGKGLSLWAVLSHSPTTEQTAQMLGLATKIHQAHPEEMSREADTSIDNQANAMMVNKTLRSGNSIEFLGHVTVIGDVNPGAEIVASGNVVVWGKLRGLVHAGAEGDEDAIVCALDLAPTQLRIAEKIAIPPEDDQEPIPEIALIRDGQVAAEPWNVLGQKI